MRIFKKEGVHEQSKRASVLDAARYLVLNGRFDDVATAQTAIRDAMKSYPNTIVEERCNVGDVIGVIHGAGGLAVWAPPLLEEGRERVAELLDNLATMGLDGVEAYHGSLDYENCVFLEGLATDRGLLVSGGSGYAGCAGVIVGQVCSDWHDCHDRLSISSALGL